MYRLMIVDDERLIRDGLRTYIDWTSLDIQVTSCCSNGLEALSEMEQQPPDLVLCDISMPHMDGIELLKQCRSAQMNSQFIFISSYAEFRYAQEALKYGAFDYLLKPIEPDALFACMQRCVKKLAEQKEYPPMPESNREMAEEWLRGALTGSVQAEKSLMRFLSRNNGHREQLQLLCLLRPNEWRFPADIIAYQCAVSENVQAALCLSPIDPNRLLKDMPHAVCCQLMDSLQSGLSEGLFRQWQLAYPAADEVETDSSGLPGKNTVASLNADAMRMALRSHLQHADVRRPFAEVTEWVDQYLTALYRQLENYYHSPLPNTPSLSRCQTELRACNNLYDLFVTCERLADTLYAALSQHPAYTVYTRKAIEIIRHHYGENLTLHGVADQLNVSSSYLSTLFKNDTGYSFSDYLYRYRMNLAADLLVNSRKKIYEIGEQVGYPDMVQFSKRFKQFYNMSPRQMRNRHESKTPV